MAAEPGSESHFQWITEDLIADVLQGDDRPVTELNKVQVFQIKTEPCVGKGENYSSDLTRVSAKYIRGHKTAFK